MAQFILAFQKTIENEGGYVNDPDDPGGETYKGVSRKNWPDWLGWICIDSLKKMGNFPVAPKTPDEIEIDNQLQYEVKTFYYQNFWIPIHGDAIDNQQVAESIFDFAVNAGVETSVELAQKTVGSDVDGAIGPNTLKAINAFDPAHFVAAFAVEKIRKYIRIIAKRPTSKKYFTGWVIRAVTFLVILFFAIGCKHDPVTPLPVEVRVDSVFLKEYVVKRMNKHELRLMSITDTVTLYMENTYGFDERIVFIKKSK